MECLFCKINKGEIPSYTIYEDEVVKVFLDINPKHNGHTLIIPKKHYKDIEDIDMDTLSHIMKIAKKMYQLLKYCLQNLLKIIFMTNLVIIIKKINSVI